MTRMSLQAKEMLGGLVVQCVILCVFYYENVLSII